MPIEHIDTLVIGGGQAGLVMSYRLKQRGILHLVLERARIAERWRSERWDGLKFQFPNWSVRLPDFAFPHSDPDAFATSGEIVEFIDAFAEFVAPPIRCGVEVTRLQRGDAGFIAETADGTIEAKQRRGRDRALSAAADTGSAARSSGVSGPCQQLSQSRASFHPAPCWWLARAHRARRSQTSCIAPAAASFSRSASTPACRAATADRI